METNNSQKTMTEQDINDIREIRNIMSGFYKESALNSENYGFDPGSVLCNLEAHKDALSNAMDLLSCLKDNTNFIMSALFDSIKKDKEIGALTDVDIRNCSQLCENIINFIGSEENLDALYYYYHEKYTRLSNIDEYELSKALRGGASSELLQW